MKKNYQHLFFDLDHTLWDFDRNAEICLQTIYAEFQLGSKGIESRSQFIQAFTTINKNLWFQLDTGKITHDYLRKQRFRIVLSDLELPIDEQLSEQMNERFLALLPNQRGLIEGAFGLLEKLSGHFQLHILSNGYYDIQLRKMQSAGIDHFFEQVITNDRANARKPEPAIFYYAMQQSNATLSTSLMIGDTFEADIVGAKAAGMDVVHYNPTAVIYANTATFTVRKLDEIGEILGK